MPRPSSPAGGTNAVFDPFPCHLGTFDIDHTELFAAQLVIIHKKVFQFAQKRLAQVANHLDVGPVVIFLLDRDYPVVAFLFFLSPLATN